MGPGTTGILIRSPGQHGLVVCLRVRGRFRLMFTLFSESAPRQVGMVLMIVLVVLCSSRRRGRNLVVGMVSL